MKKISAKNEFMSGGQAHPGRETETLPRMSSAEMGMAIPHRQKGHAGSHAR
jgi:hypothetical protein